MKATKRAFRAMVCAGVVCAAGTASAIPIIDVVNPDPNVTIGYLGSHSFTHDLTDNGFVAGIDTLVSASLAILLRDDVGNELFQFEVGLGQQESFQNVNNGAGGQTYAFGLTASSLLDLGLDGLINVTIRSLVAANQQFQTGFIFDRSTLTAEVTRGLVSTSAVPEPSVLALLGIALAGLGVAGRRKANG